MQDVWTQSELFYEIIFWFGVAWTKSDLVWRREQQIATNVPENFVLIAATSNPISWLGHARWWNYYWTRLEQYMTKVV